MVIVSKAEKKKDLQARCYILKKGGALKEIGLTPEEEKWIKARIKEDKNWIQLPRLNEIVCFLFTDKEGQLDREKARKNGVAFTALVNGEKQTEALVLDKSTSPTAALDFCEGAVLASYQFLKYRKEADKERNSLRELFLDSKNISKTALEQLNVSNEAVYKARTLVNEPQSYLNAVQLAVEFENMAKESGLKVEVLNKVKIESLKMGGLLAVNQGSNVPPTFTILEWKPAKAVNKKPIVLVGKGVVYDTGGLSLKPTANSMDYMKSDMAGAAVVGCTINAVAQMKLPVHVVALIPATDNRPGEDAYAPGDVVKMYSGLTVEVLNTDAEGRMLLADALAYASKFNPEVVFDFATLTGAAAAAIGPYATVCMGTADEKTKARLRSCGEEVNERLVEFPFWDEYKELLKSDIADIKNIGGPIAGAITAGKFLEYFVDYPWMHFDIAGPSFVHKPDSYRGKNGTGVGVRLLLEFLKKRAEK